jgi:hypothetical protein
MAGHLHSPDHPAHLAFVIQCPNRFMRLLSHISRPILPVRQALVDGWSSNAAQASFPFPDLNGGKDDPL